MLSIAGRRIALLIHAVDQARSLVGRPSFRVPPSPIVSKEDEPLADESDEDKKADAMFVPEELEQAARNHELAAEEEDLEAEI